MEFRSMGLLCGQQGKHPAGYPGRDRRFSARVRLRTAAGGAEGPPAKPGRTPDAAGNFLRRRARLLWILRSEFAIMAEKRRWNGWKRGTPS